MLLICNLNETVYICLDHIVKAGTVEVIDNKQKIIFTHQFRDSNYEKVNMNERKGNFTFRINYESETIVRHIKI